MTYTAIDDITAQVRVQEGSILSKVVHQDPAVEVTAFAFDTGQGLTEHRASRTAVVQVVSGRLRFTVDGTQLDAGPGFWLRMAPETPHALVATEPTILLLTLLST